METAQILPELNEIFRNILENDEIDLNPETVAKDIDGWDSLAHVQIMVTIEKKFKIRFKASEMAGFQNVGEIIEAIKQKTSLNA